MNDCRIGVHFAGHSPLYYRADKAAAARFAAAAATTGAVVTTDDNLAGDLKPLPCARLWRFP